MSSDRLVELIVGGDLAAFRLLDQQDEIAPVPKTFVLTRDALLRVLEAFVVGATDADEIAH